MTRCSCHEGFSEDAKQYQVNLAGRVGNRVHMLDILAT